MSVCMCATRLVCCVGLCPLVQAQLTTEGVSAPGVRFISDGPSEVQYALCSACVECGYTPNTLMDRYIDRFI